MERRLAIKQILIMAGGMALLPSCLRDSGKSSILLENIDVDLDQEMLLAEVVETMIPKTTTPGGKELKLHLFVLKMLDDCYEKAEQDAFFKGLSDFQEHTEKQFGNPFSKLATAEREKALLELENKKMTAEDGQTFYKILKRRTIDGYLNSQYVMTNLSKWELVPGRYNGYFPVKTA
ncbi:hypothetical protein IWX76_002166 [Pedobacter sp. CAN_A7]|uniref:gluconate 2-dehydrogenase subunit 3 family protein n=1 Tax=Pedobacter sp. CAN_A7 TaxID=2787722 RepID=UPI0018C9E5E7